MLYFDYSGSSLINKDILDTVFNATNFVDLFGNPSSTHNIGIISKQYLNQSRKLISSILNCKEDEIIFTSGGTESDNMALFGTMYSDNKKYNGKNELIISEIEHPAVLESAKELERRGFIVKYCKVDKNGIIDTEDLISKITDKTRLISIMTVNNEIGTIQPIKEIYKIAKQKGVIFHTDAVQAVGVTDINLKNCDMMSLSAHKFGGLKGTGILYKKRNIKISPLIYGGGQEFGLRSGTENIFGNLILALNLQNSILMWNEHRDNILNLRNYFIDKIKEIFQNNVIVNGSITDRTCNNINISFKNIDSRTLQTLIMSDGIDISIGSACHSHSNEISHVLKAIKVPKNYINGTLRITLSYETNRSEIDILLQDIIKHVNYLYQMKGENNGEI